MYVDTSRFVNTPNSLFREKNLGSAVRRYSPHERIFCKSQIGHCVKLFLGVSTHRAIRKYRLLSAGDKICGFQGHHPPNLDKYLLRCEAMYSIRSSSISTGISKNLSTRLYGVISHNINVDSQNDYL